jgi:hypothetical protein
MIDEIKRLEGIVFDNENSFLQNFSPVGSTSDLLWIWFGSSSVKIHYVDLDSGQHYADEIENEKFSAWMKSRIDYSSYSVIQ